MAIIRKLRGNTLTIGGATLVAKILSRHQHQQHSHIFKQIQQTYLFYVDLQKHKNRLICSFEANF